MTAALDVPPKARSAHTRTITCSACWRRQVSGFQALALQCNDLVEDGLIVRNGKFGKQRLMPCSHRPAKRSKPISRPAQARRHGQ
jgi:hypothetical protein